MTNELMTNEQVSRLESVNRFKQLTILINNLFFDF